MDTRRGFLRAALPGSAAAALAASAAPAFAESPRTPAGPIFDVTEFGAAGDGATPCAQAFQAAIDAAEAAGGGVVRIPPGRFVLERTPLIGSRVHLMGSGAGTVLRGARPPGHRGAALISNKGQQAPRYEGAHDWGVSHFAIDSPDTNGIVVTHAARVYIGFIHGVDVYHHFVDTAGRDILCENLWLTGRSGTSTFQIDSVSSAQTIWDGAQAVGPLRDGTDTEFLVLRNSVITATAGHTGSRPQHDASIHFHGDEARGFVFSDLFLGGAATGFYQDPGTAYHEILINNVHAENPGRAIWFSGGKPGQRQLCVRGLLHGPRSGEPGPYQGIAIDGRESLSLSDIHLNAPEHAEGGRALEIAGCAQIRLAGLVARGQGGAGVWIRGGAEQARVEQALVDGCLLHGFDIGCGCEDVESGAVAAGRNLFRETGTEYQGPIIMG